MLKKTGYFEGQNTNRKGIQPNLVEKYSDIAFLMTKQVCKHSVTWTKVACLGLCDRQKRSQQSLRAQLNF